MKNLKDFSKKETMLAWIKETKNTNVHDYLDHSGLVTVRSPRTIRRVKNRFKKVVASIHESDTEEHEEQPVLSGFVPGPNKTLKSSTVRTFILTCAQSSTKVHEQFFKNLVAYSEFISADLHISRFNYNRYIYGPDKSNLGTDHNKSGSVWFDPKIVPFLSDEDIELAPGLVWCGRMNIRPTAVNPLSGLSNYYRGSSCVFPHVKMHMESVPTVCGGSKFLYTTGTCTQRNYIQCKAGQKAELHHVFGALVVEVSSTGLFWVRQINASDDGSFFDLKTYVSSSGEIQHSHNTASITHGDFHGLNMDLNIRQVVFGERGIVDILRPREQFVHDAIDFYSRNHHNIRDPHHLSKAKINCKESVEEEIKYTARMFLDYVTRPWCKTFIVQSNHDNAFTKWLKDFRGAMDPVNAKIWHTGNLYVINQLSAGKEPQPFWHFLRMYFNEYYNSRRTLKNFKTRRHLNFISECSSFLVCDRVEAAVHGHLGPNGARGSVSNLRVLGRLNTGHTHSACIKDGVYTAGTYSKLRLGYNTGPSNWNHSFILTYNNGKSCILTIKEGRAWR